MAVIALRGIVKAHGGLRPLRLRELDVAPGEVVTVSGLDTVQAAVLVDLLTGTVLPDAGEVEIGGWSTKDIPDQEAWLAFLDQFGLVNDRVVFLEELTVAQNLAVPLTLAIDPMAADVLGRVTALSEEIGLPGGHLDERMAGVSQVTRALVRLGRALALDPSVLLMEHPTLALDRAEVPGFAAAVRTAAARRGLSVLALTADPVFIDDAATRALSWRAATGAVSSARGPGRLFGR